MHRVFVQYLMYLLSNRGDKELSMGENVPDVNIGLGKVIDIQAGHDHTCAVLMSGDLKCWGRNEAGQLAIGDPKHRGDDEDEMGEDLPTVNLGRFKVLRVHCGGHSTCVVLKYTLQKNTY